MMIAIYFILFLFVSVFCFTLPGFYLLHKIKGYFGLPEKIVLGTIVGFVSFTLLSYILMVLNSSLFLLPIIVFIDILSAKAIFTQKINFIFSSKKESLIIFLIFTLGIVGQMAIIAPSGLYNEGDLIFFSSNGHDGPWHIALMEEIKKGYPLQNPVFAGEKLVNYHFFSDIAPAQFSKYFRFSNLDLYFRFFPFLFSILLGSVAFLVGKRVGKSSSVGIWSTFFVYFAGSFGFFVTWIQNHTISGEIIFWATQIQSSIGNPPQIISNILVLTFLYFVSFFPKKNWRLFGLTIILLGSLAEFKIYASVVVLISLIIFGIIEVIKNSKIYFLSLAFLSGLLSAILYLPNSVNSTSFLIWEPWWFIRTMIVAKLNWIDLEHKRQTYIAEGNFKRVIQIELTGFLIFFFGNLGTRFLGLISLFKSFKDSSFTQISLLIVTTSLILPLLFLQKGVASNTIQFLQYFLLIFGVFAAIAIAKLQNKTKKFYLKILFIIIIILFSIPTQIGLLYDFYHKPPLAKISSSEIQALNFLKENTDKNSVVLTAPFNKYLNLNMSTPFIWAWFDTSYVSAFSERRTYLADIEQIDIMGYPYQKRLAVQKLIFESNLKNEGLKELKSNKIDYLYFPKQLKPKTDLSTNLRKIFDNGQVEIWKVN